MNIPPFKLEEFWKEYEFTTPYLLCCSDAESWTLQELLALADKESLELWHSLTLGYTESPGHPLLRREVAQLYTSMQPDQILTFAGAEEGIYCAMRVLIEPGDHVIVVDPCYQSLRALPEAFGAQVSSIKLQASNQWQLDLDEVRQAFRANTKLLILNTPHNPTGTVLSKETIEQLVQLARQSGAYIFCDEVYRYLEVDEAERPPSLADAYERAISLNVMTKSFGLAGLRIGWLASQDADFLRQAGDYKLYTSICNSAPSEILALMGLRARETILKRNRNIVLHNLKLLDAFMQRHRQKLSWVRPQGGTVAVLELLLQLPVEAFADSLRRSQGVLVMPGSVFDLPGNYFRIGFGRKNMPEILERLERFLQ